MITTRRSRQVTHADNSMIEDVVRESVLNALGARLGLDLDAVLGLVTNTRQLVADRVRLDKLSAVEIDWQGMNDHGHDIACALLSQRLAQ